MNKKIAILRGINVGGKRKILMSDLKSLCKKLGWEEVQTYIQTGNLIFNSNTQNSALECTLEKAIKSEFGHDIPVIIRTSHELQISIDNNPFFNKETEINSLHLTFLKEKPTDKNIEQIYSYECEPDRFEIISKDIYIFCTGKYHKSKLTNTFFEKKLKVDATTRNWKTVLKLLELTK